VCSPLVVSREAPDCHGSLIEFANRWLTQLEARQFAPGTVREYAFDLLCLARFFDEASIDWQKATPTDFFDWLEWQSRPVSTKGKTVVRLEAKRGAAAATVNRRVAAARGLFEHAVRCWTETRCLRRDAVAGCEVHAGVCSAMSADGGPLRQRSTLRRRGADPWLALPKRT
jgi:Phage integrase, N-terminal SAM-like domain